MISQARTHRAEVLITVGVTAAVWLLNSRFVLVRPLLWTATLAHEASHAAAAAILGKNVGSVTVNVHGGGLAYWSGHASTFDIVVIGSAGYVGAALVGAIVLESCRWLRGARVACVLGAAIIATVGLLWVPWSFNPEAGPAAITRSSSADGRFTVFFCVAAVIVLLAVAVQPFARARRAFLVVIATALCLLSVESLKVVLNLSSRGGDSDATTVAAVTPLSSWMWSAIWLTCGALLCAVTVWSLVTRDQKLPSPRDSGPGGAS